jgi:hypothetical protein
LREGQNFSAFVRRGCFCDNERVSLEVAAASEALAAEFPMLWRNSHETRALRVVTGETAVTMQRASAGIVASGSATLEAAYFRLPFVLIYKVTWPTYSRSTRRKREISGMPNVLADKEFRIHSAPGKAGCDCRSSCATMDNTDARPDAAGSMQSSASWAKAAPAKSGASVIEDIGRST